MKILFLSFFLLLNNFLFAQTTLSEYISLAQLNNPIINDNRNLSEITRLESERLKAFYSKPQVFLSGGATYSPFFNNAGYTNSDPSPQAIGYDLAISNGGIYSGTLNVNQSIFNRSRYQANVAFVKVAGLINSNFAKLTEHDLERFITDQYIICYQDLQQIIYIAGVIKLLNEQKNLIQSLVDNGLLKQSDLTLLNIEHQTQQVLNNTFKATYKRDLMSLKALAGVGDTSVVEILDPALSLSGQVENSKYMEKFRLDSLNAVANQSFFDLRYKPQTILFANTGFNAVQLPGIERKFGLSAGFTFNLILFDGGQRNINRQKTKLSIKTVSGYQNNFFAQNTVRKNQALQELNAVEDRINLINSQLDAYKQLMATYKQELLRGQISVINYINTIKLYVTLQRDLVITRSNRLLLINAYNYWNW